MLISLLRSFLKQSRFVHLTPNKVCSASPSLASRIQTLEVSQLLPSLRIHTAHRHSSQGFHLCPGNAHRLHTSLLLSSDYRLLKGVLPLSSVQHALYFQTPGLLQALWM